ncbi:MAG: molybdenum cofactor guanylyltransferase [Chthonomonadales bacterium]
MAGIVLAGGKSIRMGRDKASLLWDGRTLLDAVVARLGEVTHPVYVVASPASTCPAPHDTKVVHDIVMDAGPLAGIVTGLMAAGTGNHLVAACDMPFLNARVLQLLLQLVEGHDAAVPVVHGCLQPTCAAYSGRAVAHLRARLNEGERALHRALESMDVLHVAQALLEEVDPRLLTFTNINTPGDLARCKAVTTEPAATVFPADEAYS